MPQNPLFEIVTPSDALTMRAASFEVGAAAVMLLGRGQLGLDEVDGERETPVLLGWPEFIEETYGGTKGLDAFMSRHRAEIAEALLSVALGSVAGREDFDLAFASTPEGDREAFMAKRNDQLRSSMSDIETAARKLGRKLQEDPGA